VIGGIEAWRIVTSRAAVPFQLPGRGAAMRALREEVRALPAGTPVVLCDAARGRRGRCRRFASEAGVELDAEYLAIPSLRSPRYLVEDVPETLDYLWAELAVLPLPSPALAVARLVLRVAGALGLWRWAALAFSGRIAVGRRR